MQSTDGAQQTEQLQGHQKMEMEEVAFCEWNLSGQNEGQWRRLEIHLFSGDDAYVWVNRPERYFPIKELLEEERLKAVMVVMEGRTLSWFQ